MTIRVNVFVRRVIGWMYRINVKVSINIKIRKNVKVRIWGFYSIVSFLFGKLSNVFIDLYFVGVSIKNSINFLKRKLLVIK